MNFLKYITTDFIKSKHITPNYLMVYRFYMPEKPFINEEIRFTVDSAGSILKNMKSLVFQCVIRIQIIVIL